MGPEIALGIMSLAASVGSTAISAEESAKARRQQKKLSQESENARLEAARKERSEFRERAHQLQRRRAAGAGGGTILGGELGEQTEIGRSILLGQ